MGFLWTQKKQVFNSAYFLLPLPTRGSSSDLQENHCWVASDPLFGQNSVVVPRPKELDVWYPCEQAPTWCPCMWTELPGTDGTGEQTWFRWTETVAICI